MDNFPKHKVYNFKLSPKKLRSRTYSRYVFNQQTIVGSYCSFKMSQKMMIALFLVREKGGREVTVPVGFSVDSTLIPTDLKPLEVHYDNYVKITVKGHQPFTAMIISVGGK